MNDVNIVTLDFASALVRKNTEYINSFVTQVILFPGIHHQLELMEYSASLISCAEVEIFAERYVSICPFRNGIEQIWCCTRKFLYLREQYF